MAEHHQSAPAGPVLRAPKGWSGPRIATWLILALAVLGAAAWFRYVVVEPRSMGFACSEMPTPSWCAPREWIIQLHLNNVWGIAALAFGALALFLRQNWAVPAGIIAGLAGMVLYDTSLASAGFLLALLRLVRS
jgi:hypothetical protein